MVKYQRLSHSSVYFSVFATVSADDHNDYLALPNEMVAHLQPIEMDFGDFRRRPKNMFDEYYPSYTIPKDAGVESDTAFHLNPWEFNNFSGTVVDRLLATSGDHYHLVGSSYTTHYRSFGRRYSAKVESFTTFGGIGYSLAVWTYTQYNEKFEQISNNHYAVPYRFNAKGQAETSSMSVIYSRPDKEREVSEVISLARSKAYTKWGVPQIDVCISEGFNTSGYHSIPSDWYKAYEQRINWGELAREAYQDLGFWNGNGIAYLNDCREMKETLSRSLSTVKNLKRGNVPKALSDLYLSFHYGYKLMVQDSIDIIDQFRKLDSVATGVTSVRAQQSNGATTGRYQVFFEKFKKLTNDLDRLVALFDARPTLENMWDMVPFSFCIDWFADVSSTLQGIDTYRSLQQEHEVLAVGRTTVTDVTFSPDRFGFENCDGVVRAIYYIRLYDLSPQIPDFLPDVTINVGRHATEATALVVSNPHIG